MTSEGLRLLLEADDASGCIVFFAGASETARRKLAKPAAAELRSATEFVTGRFLTRLSHLTEEDIRRWFRDRDVKLGRIRAAQIAVLATATIGELKRFGERCMPPIEDACAVLADRKPPWVGQWAEALLASRESNHWAYVRRLIREGFCERPRGPQYINGMIGGLYGRTPAGGIHEALVEDPALLEEEVWEIFETEPERGRLDSLPAVPAARDPSGWAAALVRLASEGRLSRERLLDASLSGLDRDFHEARARWLAIMHEALEPTSDERAQCAGRYCALLASHNASTVKFAIQALAELDHDDRLAPKRLLDAIGPALLARAKGTVLPALSLISAAARREPGAGVRAATVAAGALAHESPAVCEAVLDIVEQHGDRSDRALVEILETHRELIAPSQRTRLDAWLGARLKSGLVESASHIAAAEGADLRARAAALDPHWAWLAGVDVALKAVECPNGEIAAISFSEMEIPRLDPAQRVTPIEDLDTLIEEFSAVLAGAATVDDVERVLDGLSRLCDQIPHDFPARTAPLRLRAEQPETPWAYGALRLRILALEWTSQRRCDEGRGFSSSHYGIMGLLERRLSALGDRVVERQAAPLLGAPTHRGGWIDPRALVERARAWANLPFRSDRLDASIALLRLAPDSGPRAEALSAANTLSGPFAAALRYALGGAGETVGPDARLWVAAARARAPRADDPLVEARHPGLGPDAGCAATFALRPENRSFPWIQQRVTWHSLIATEPHLPAEPECELPTVLLHNPLAHMGGILTRWTNTLWPLGTESLLAAGLDIVVGREDRTGFAHMKKPSLERILDPDVPLGPMGRLLVAGGLSVAEPEVRTLAVDCLIAAIDDGRLDGRGLGEALHELLLAELAKPSRFAKALAEAARASPLHARVVALALQVTLAELPEPIRDLHKLLELLKELLIEAGEPMSVPGAKAYLAGLKISGKTAKLILELLALTEASENTRASAAACALAGRVARAERWMALSGG